MTYIQMIDDLILIFIQDNFRYPLLDKLMIFASFLGNNGAIWVIIALLLMINKKHRWTGFAIAIALIFCLLIGNITLKPLIARARPFIINIDRTLLIAPPTDFSFPSGHTMTSFAAAMVLYLKKKIWGIPALIVATIIAFSRMYLFVHYPSDIFGGLLIGIGMAILAMEIAKKFDKTKCNFIQ